MEAFLCNEQYYFIISLSQAKVLLCEILCLIFQILILFRIYKNRYFCQRFYVLL